LSAGIQPIPNLSYIALDNHGILLSAHRSFIHIYMVASDTRKLCEELLISFGLPELCRRFATPEKVPLGKAPRQVIHDDSCDFELCRYEKKLLLRILLQTYKPREPQRYSVSELGKLNLTVRSE
jgi:hypothetical protein